MRGFKVWFVDLELVALAKRREGEVTSEGTVLAGAYGVERLRRAPWRGIKGTV